MATCQSSYHHFNSTNVYSFRFDPNLMSVRILEHDRNSTSDTETQEFKVEQVIKHSGYSTFNYNNDIALVKLKGTIKFEGKMRPVCLPERGNILNAAFMHNNIVNRITRVLIIFSFIIPSYKCTVSCSYDIPWFRFNFRRNLLNNFGSDLTFAGIYWTILVQNASILHIYGKRLWNKK